jgi:hypothetical protein
MIDRTSTPLIYVSDCYRSAEIRRHRRACYANGQPFVARYKHGSARWWRVVWEAEAMTKDRWDPRLTSETEERIAALVRSALEASYRAGSRNAWGTYGSVRGGLHGLSPAAAETLCAELVVIYADPASFRSLHAPGDFAGTCPWPQTLRFDWAPNGGAA